MVAAVSSVLFWSSLAASAGSTFLQMGQQKKAQEYQQIQLENRKLAERNSATEQTTQRISEMSKAMSSRAVASAAYGTLNGSVYQNAIQKESITAAEDISAIDTNLALTELGLESRSAASKSTYKMDQLGTLLGGAKSMLDTFSFYELTNPTTSLNTPLSTALPSPF